MTHQAFNAVAVKEEISEVVEDTSADSVMQEESGSEFVMLPVKVELKEETEDSLLMAGGWYTSLYSLEEGKLKLHYWI